MPQTIKWMLPVVLLLPLRSAAQLLGIQTSVSIPVSGSQYALNSLAGLDYEQAFGKLFSLRAGLGWARLRDLEEPGRVMGLELRTLRLDLVELPLDALVNTAQQPGRGWNSLFCLGYSYCRTVSVKEHTSRPVGWRNEWEDRAAGDFSPVQYLRAGYEARRYFSNGQHLSIGLQLRVGGWDGVGLYLCDLCFSAKTGLRFGKPAVKAPSPCPGR